MSEHEVIGRTPTPATVESLARDLRALGVAPGMTLVVHSSLSALGWVCGGALAVIRALEAAVGEDGDLVMPAHTPDVSEPSYWTNPPVPEAWWETIREHMPAFDATATPTRAMGRIAECFRKLPGAWRSEHPQHSFAARGPEALHITGVHPLDYGMGPESPLGHLYERDAHVLLLGVGQDRNSSLHLAEYVADWPGKREIEQGAPVLLRDGLAREWKVFRDVDLDPDDFGRIGDAFGDRARRGRVACAEALLMRQREIVDFGVAWMRAHRGRGRG